MVEPKNNVAVAHACFGVAELATTRSFEFQNHDIIPPIRISCFFNGLRNVYDYGVHIEPSRCERRAEEPFCTQERDMVVSPE
jgi:hypothetical protein